MTGSLKDTGCKPQSHGQADPGGGPCPRCGRPRCSAAAKTRPGERCRKNPHPGATICTNHGLTAAGRAAAEGRVLEKQAEGELRKIWGGLSEATPVKDPVGSLERLAGALEQAVDVVGDKVNALGNIAGGTGLTQLRGEVVLLERLLGQLRQALDAMARLGIAERHVELEQARAEMVYAALVAALASVTLLPADRDLVVRTFLRELGRGPEELEGVPA